MKKIQTSIVATALLALGLTLAAPARAADPVADYLKTARKVFDGKSTAADAIKAAAGKKDFAGKVGELSAALSAVEVAKETPKLGEALAGIVTAVSENGGDDAVALASRAAATVAAVTGDKGVAKALADKALADAAKKPDSVLSGADKANLKDLYEKILAALKPDKYGMKGNEDKVDAGKAADAKDKDGKDGKGGKDGKDGKGGDSAGAAGAAGAAGSDGSAAGGSDGSSFAGGSDGEAPAGDPVDQTVDNPHEYHATPTTLSGMGIPGGAAEPPPATPPKKPSKPKPTKSSPTPVGLR